MIDLKAYLSQNPYPGRGILLGRSADDAKAAIEKVGGTCEVLANDAE